MVCAMCWVFGGSAALGSLFRNKEGETATWKGHLVTALKVGAMAVLTSKVIKWLTQGQLHGGSPTFSSLPPWPRVAAFVIVGGLVGLVAKMVWNRFFAPAPCCCQREGGER